MPQRTIKLSDGKIIPALGWGNGSGGIMRNSEKAVDCGVSALKAGILHIDTAQYYETEAETAEAIVKSGISRDKVWITDKVSDNKVSQTEPGVIREAVLESLAKLDTRPDLLLIHNPNVGDAAKQGKIAEFWRILEDMVFDGTLHNVSLGFSNFRPQDVQEVLKVARINPVVNQLEFHPYVLAQLEPLLELQKKNGITTEAYGPLTPLLRHPTGGPVKPVLERIARAHGCDPASVLYLWTVQKGVVAVTTSTNPDNIKKIADVNSLPDLSADEIKEIDDAGKKVHFRYYKEHMTTDYPAPNLPEDA